MWLLFHVHVTVWEMCEISSTHLFYFNMNQANRFAGKRGKLSTVWEIHARKMITSMKNTTAVCSLWSSTVYETLFWY